MSDLISRQAVIEMLTKVEIENWFPTFAMLKSKVSDIQTAYDVEKVVEKIQEESDKAEDMILTSDAPQYYDGFGDGIDKAIEIVKAGGVNG